MPEATQNKVYLNKKEIWEYDQCAGPEQPLTRVLPFC